MPVQTTVVASREPAAEHRHMHPDESPKVPARLLSVPPPPGRPTVPGSNRSFSFSRARAVRPEDDPFLAAYLACTGGGGGRCSGSRNGDAANWRLETKGRRRFTWAGLGLGLSCKGSGAAVEQSMVKLAKRPELHRSY